MQYLKSEQGQGVDRAKLVSLVFSIISLFFCAAKSVGVPGGLSLGCDPSILYYLHPVGDPSRMPRRVRILPMFSERIVVQRFVPIREANAFLILLDLMYAPFGEF